MVVTYHEILGKQKIEDLEAQMSNYWGGHYRWFLGALKDDYQNYCRREQEEAERRHKELVELEKKRLALEKQQAEAIQKQLAEQKRQLRFDPSEPPTNDGFHQLI